MKDKARLDERFQKLQEQATQALERAFTLLTAAATLWGNDDPIGFAEQIRRVAKEHVLTGALYNQIASECEAALSNEPGTEN